ENLKPGTTSWASACNEIREALEEYSFFEVVYSKPSREFLEEILSSLREVFHLPAEVKAKNVHPKLGHGYMGKIPGFPEGLGIEYATNKEECQKFTNLMWPEGNDSFCYGLEKYYESNAESTIYLLKLLKYGRSRGETNVGFKAHMDKTFLTLLYQNHVRGLEIKTKDGQWIPYQPSSPASFAVIAGDVCMAWSNDRIKSSYHRVIVTGNEDRYALGLFTFLRGVIETPQELVDDEHPLKYRPFEHEGLLDFYQASNDPNKRDRNIVKAYCGVN
ncbi:hypothetical protein Tsubulata_042123, partial [Turnera subulata]